MVIRQQPGGALRLSALVWLVWYRMGVTRGGRVDGGVRVMYASAGTVAVAEVWLARCPLVA